MASKAEDRRFEALRKLVDDWKDTAYTGTCTVDELVAAIDALAPLGKTQRWGTAIERWKTLVREYPNDRYWALLEGSTGAGYAAR